MRRALVACVVCALSSRAAAEPMPPGTLGFVFGVVSGTGADAKRLGFGFHQFGMQAAYQPISTEQWWGPTLRWSTMFGWMFNADAAQIDSELHTMQMDLMAGVRFRPWKTPSRYLTARIGGELLRANEPIPPLMQRAFFGGIASVGLDQYIGGFQFNFDVRYGLIAVDAPSSLSLLVGVGVVGP